MSDFRVELDIFRGPLDLLLYLVRRHEVELAEIPVAAITDQYLGYLSVLAEIDVNAVGDFVAVASILVELKSQQALPQAEDTELLVEEDRRDLVERLLEYKRYRDAASVLEERGRQWQRRYPRLAADLTPSQRDVADEPIHEVELWDLVSAFGRIMRDTEASKPSNIIYDETPIAVYMERIRARVLRTGRLSFADLFEPGMHKSTLVGIFLAALELVRHGHVRVEQDRLFGEIHLLARPETAAPGELSSGASCAPDDAYSPSGSLRSISSRS